MIVRATVRAELRETLQAFQTFAAASSTDSSSIAPRWTACAIRLRSFVFQRLNQSEIDAPSIGENQESSARQFQQKSFFWSILTPPPRPRLRRRREALY